MTSSQIAQQRLHNQRLAATDLKLPAEVVQWLGAVQAQDYYGAKWALAQRMLAQRLEATTDANIEKAFAGGAILRTHVLRPTWHFVAPAHIRWMLQLTAPRVHAISSHYYRKFELDTAVFKQCHKAIIKALAGGKQLTRAALRDAVQQSVIGAEDLLRFGLILLHAELEGIICSGARVGSQFTYTLLEERVPKVKAVPRDEALARLTGRYFISRGPATLQDYVWWSGLTATDARTGLEMVQPQLVNEVIDGKTYWRSSAAVVLKPASPAAYLLPCYDEYLIAYKDRSAALDSSASMKVMGRNPIFHSVVVIGGRVVGGWKRTITPGGVIVTLSPFRSLTKADMRAVAKTARDYGDFLELPVVLG